MVHPSLARPRVGVSDRTTTCVHWPLSRLLGAFQNSKPSRLVATLCAGPASAWVSLRHTINSASVGQ